jgi:hypothetical protein
MTAGKKRLKNSLKRPQLTKKKNILHFSTHITFIKLKWGASIPLDELLTLMAVESMVWM